MYWLLVDSFIDLGLTIPFPLAPAAVQRLSRLPLPPVEQANTVKHQACCPEDSIAFSKAQP